MSDGFDCKTFLIVYFCLFIIMFVGAYVGFDGVIFLFILTFISVLFCCSYDYITNYGKNEGVGE